MAWREVTTLTQRFEFVMLAKHDDCNFSKLCKSYDISRKTGYKWLARFMSHGKDGLVDLSRRPLTSPNKCNGSVESAIVDLREKRPGWGGRKLKARLETLGHQGVPGASTITEVLRRNGLLDPAVASQHTAYISFEHPYPNSLWQMDFKGHFAMRQGRCHPLTVLDDHSRFNLVLEACSDERTKTVQDALIDCFRRYGLPDRMTMDNGSPWGNDQFCELTPLTAWLVQLGIRVSHSRPYHPQTQGKDERFHRTLKVEVIIRHQFHDLPHCQREFDSFRDVYNLERPHESLGMKPPISRYVSSSRTYPEALPAIEYGPDDHVRKVQAKGVIFFKGREFRVPKGLQGSPVALRPMNVDGSYSIHFCHQKLKEISLNESEY
jgi:transposase InsO family protein